jgi:hypothetical protein
VLNIYTRNTDQILVDDTSGSLVIEGCYITNQKIDSSGNPDPQYNYWPEVHLRSSSGQRVSFTTNQSHFENMSDRCQSRLVVPASELVTTMRGMKSGRISLDLKLTHDNDEFAGFPSNELPVPGGSFTYVGAASLSHVEGSYLKVGSRNIVKGQNLSIFNKNALTSYVTSSINDTNVTEFTSVTYIDDETIAIDIPQSALLVGSFVLSLHTLDASSTSFSLAVPGPINVAPPTLSTIQLSDRGAKADDNMYVEVLDANSEPILISANDFIKVQLPAGNSSATLIFDSSNLQILDFDTSQAVPATWPIKFVVVCVDGGKEETCTWDLRGTVKSRNGGQTYTIQEKGKLKNNRDITVTLP